MKQMIRIGCLALSLVACRHAAPVTEDPVIWKGSEVRLQNWLEYSNALEAMNPRELKQEADRLRKNPGEVRSWDDELRWALCQAVQHGKNHNFQKAYEQIQPYVARAYLPQDLKSWLRLYSQQLYAAAQLEKDWLEDKRVRLELEKKLKALSDLELELSQRSRVTR